MSATTFTTQRQLMMKNMPASALDNPFAQQQKLLLYVLPVVFAVSGVNFPIGVLIYWLTTNVWSMGQQFYVIRRMPAPGSPAEKALAERRKKRGKPAPGEMRVPERRRPGRRRDREAGCQAGAAEEAASKQAHRSAALVAPGAGTGDPSTQSGDRRAVRPGGREAASCQRRQAGRDVHR